MTFKDIVWLIKWAAILAPLERLIEYHPEILLDFVVGFIVLLVCVYRENEKNYRPETFTINGRIYYVDWRLNGH